MATYTTEIASDKIPSDNPIHQRLLQAYYLAMPSIKGQLLELGCGEGRGVELLSPLADGYVALDKIGEVIERLQQKYPGVDFRQAVFPPFKGLADNSFDTIVSFQVIEHVKEDKAFLKEIYRVLKPGGKAVLTTPNIKKTLTRNPWHVREYTAQELTQLAQTIFPKVTMKGVGGNHKVMAYYEQNKRAVEKITRFDIFNLQYRLPAPLLRIPYDILNRLNRNKLNTANTGLVAEIKHTDYVLIDEADEALDLFLVVEK
ncbi:class I SAM-dependent methyltransferase [Roseivirga sp. UBA838]|uniref:class I SAM-dependent methyltransferase n=1 Tax=Roseivirga sp. UBA838 TaxID=1947393 RepID=UPI00257EA691|nr:class I SAM-dependent methyltransferase [Roseivirga sp. UBA838]|tara:strand:- start:32825 stop:33598 length:774 start_codon:yes stop_codon:yes gene_type:complete